MIGISRTLYCPSLTLHLHQPVHLYASRPMFDPAQSNASWMVWFHARRTCTLQQRGQQLNFWGIIPGDNAKNAWLAILDVCVGIDNCENDNNTVSGSQWCLNLLIVALDKASPIYSHSVQYRCMHIDITLFACVSFTLCQVMWCGYNNNYYHTTPV